MSENRRTRRYLLRKGGTKNLGEIYVDNKGIEYDHKWAAKLSSLWNFIIGGLMNGFPIVVPVLWYQAWAMYPFFFVRRDINIGKAIDVLNHERIHAKQQLETILLFGIPLLMGCIYYQSFSYLVMLPFIPSYLYLLDMARVITEDVIKNRRVLPLQKYREKTCFEQEAVNCSRNPGYIIHRKAFNFINYV
jgi:hypothetical protein